MWLFRSSTKMVVAGRNRKGQRRLREEVPIVREGLNTELCSNQRDKRQADPHSDTGQK